MNIEEIERVSLVIRDASNNDLKMFSGKKGATQDDLLDFSSYASFVHRDEPRMVYLSEAMGIDVHGDIFEWFFSLYWIKVDNNLSGIADRMDYFLQYGLPYGWKLMLIGYVMPIYFGKRRKKYHKLLLTTPEEMELIDKIGTYPTVKVDIRKQYVDNDTLSEMSNPKQSWSKNKHIMNISLYTRVASFIKVLKINILMVASKASFKYNDSAN